MKTVCKKLFSLMLVALMLVSVMPFAAMAADWYEFTYKFGGSSMTTRDTDGTVTKAEAIEYFAEEDVEENDFNFIGDGIDVKGGNVVIDIDNATYYTSGTLIGGDNNNNNDDGEDDTSAIIPDDGNGEGDNTSSTTPDGEAAPEGGVISCDLTVDYKLSGYEVRTYTTTAGTLYKNFVGVPARNGYDFLGWHSSYYGRVVDITKDMIMGDDTITGMWSAAKQYSLTLDENRGETETVNSVKQVTYGQAIGTLPTPERDGYVFMGWKLNGTIITAKTVWDLPGDGTAYAQWKLESDTEDKPMGGGTATADGKVYLEIYLNGDTATLEKRVNITDYADDNKITQAEVEKVVKKYYSAKSGYTLKFEGLYDEETWWWYTRDPETDGAKSITVNMDGDDYVYVMVKNVKVTEADSTNPKTGDGIFAVMSVMMGSGAAIVSLSELRKRKMI